MYLILGDFVRDVVFTVPPDFIIEAKINVIIVGRVVTGPQKQNDNQPESSYVFSSGQTKPDFGLIFNKKRVQNHGHNRPLIALV